MELFSSSWLNVTANICLLIAAIVLLWKGADAMVESASRIAVKLGVSELVIGLTIVAFGTSAPELAVSVSAAINKLNDISVGNVVGSNIFNIGFILGIVAIIRPVEVTKKLVYRDGALMVISVLMLLLFFRDFLLDRWEAAILFAMLIAYLIFLFIKKDPMGESESETEKATGKDWLILPISIAAIVFGGDLLVKSASFLATLAGISPWVIGVTIVAAGTSAPEMAASIAAVVKGHYGISAGNLVGSNIFNAFGILGIAGIIRPLGMDGGHVLISLSLLAGLLLLSVVFMRTGWKVSRAEGAAMVLIGLAIWIRDFIQ